MIVTRLLSWPVPLTTRLLLQNHVGRSCQARLANRLLRLSQRFLTFDFPLIIGRGARRQLNERAEPAKTIFQYLALQLIGIGSGSEISFPYDDP